MPYELIRRPIGTVSGLSDGADGGRLLNLYSSAAVIPQESVVPVMVRGTPGYVNNSFDDSPDEQSRVLMAAVHPSYGNHILVLTDDNLYVYVQTSSGPLDRVAKIPIPSEYNLTHDDDKPLRWATDGRIVAFITDSEIYAFDRAKVKEHIDDPDSTEHVWVSITAPTPDDDSDDTDTEAWVDIVWIDGYFVLAAKGGQMFNSEIRQTTFDQLDFARADVKPDGIVGMETLGQTIYVFGERSIEMWVNAGLPQFAFRRQKQVSYDVGCYSRETITRNELAIHFLGSDLSWHSLAAGGRLQKISNDTVDRVIRRDSGRGDHTFLSFQYTEEGHKFVGFQSKEGGQWVFDWNTRMWHERTSTKTEFIVGVVRSDTKVYCLISTHSAIYRISLEFDKHPFGGSGEAADQAIEREMILPIIQLDQRRVRHTSFQADIHYEGGGNPALSLILGWSDDNKDTFVERAARMWQRGIRSKWNNLGLSGSRGRNYRLRLSGTNGEVVILGAYIEAEELTD